MKRAIQLLTVFFLLQGCGVIKRKTKSSSYRTVTIKPKRSDDVGSVKIIPKTVDAANNEPKNIAQIDNVIRTALTFSGVRYKYGGTSKQGMDCSGLVYTSFNKNDIAFPRVSHVMAEEGEQIKLSDVRKGDLLFFRTTRRSGKINHVGLVVDVNEDDIKFIHASTSRGVIVSSIMEGFWNAAFVKATRVF